MIELDLAVPPDELGWKEGDLALSDWPLVRQVVRPVYPAAGRGFGRGVARRAN